MASRSDTAVAMVLAGMIALIILAVFLKRSPPHVTPPPPAVAPPSMITDPISRALVALPMESATQQPLMMPSKRLALETKEDSVQFFLDVEIPEATRKDGYQLHLLVETGHGVRVVPPVIGAETRSVRPPIRFLEEGGIENVMWDGYVFDFGQGKAFFPHTWGFGLIVPPRQRFKVTAVTYPSAVLTR